MRNWVSTSSWRGRDSGNYDTGAWLNKRAKGWPGVRAICYNANKLFQPMVKSYSKHDPALGVTYGRIKSGDMDREVGQGSTT